MPTRIIKIPNAKIMFRNFRGEKRRYNDEGDRNFCVVLSELEAEEYSMNGLPVKAYEPKSGDGEVVHLLKVDVSYKYKDRAPTAMMIKKDSKTFLKEDTIGNLDFAEIEKLDLILNASFYTRTDGTQGVGVYLNTLYAKVFEDEFALQYANLPVTNPEDDAD